MPHTFDLGEIVTIFNQTLGGRFFIEGRAAIVKRIKGVDEQYVVRFRDDGPRDTYERFVDPAGQDDPEAFVAKLNAACVPA